MVKFSPMFFNNTGIVLGGVGDRRNFVLLLTGVAQVRDAQRYPLIIPAESQNITNKKKPTSGTIRKSKILEWVFIHCSSSLWPYLLLGLKRTYSRACVELLAVEMKLKRRKTRSGMPSTCVSCLWITCSLNDICCCVFLRNRYQPITFCGANVKGHLYSKITLENKITSAKTADRFIYQLQCSKNNGLLHIN